MKKLLTLLILFVSLSVVAQTKRNVETDKSGNYVSLPSKRKSKVGNQQVKHIQILKVKYILYMKVLMVSFMFIG